MPYSCSVTHTRIILQVCHVGDALGEDAVVPGGFAGIVVDLFADGVILPELREVCLAEMPRAWLTSDSALESLCSLLNRKQTLQRALQTIFALSS